MNIIAIIPARSNSKSIRHKNIRQLAGKPMMAYSIEQALASNYINRVIVSTDSEEYAAIAKKYGAEVPFLRPAEYAKDDSTDLEVFVHALEWLAIHENYEPEACVHLRPTHPIRKVEEIDNCIDILLKNQSYDSVRSIAPAPETPFKMWFRDEKGQISPVVTDDTIKDAYNKPRQYLPKTYLQNACIDVVRSSVILEQHSMTGNNLYGYVMSENYDIDYERDFLKADLILKTLNSKKNQKKTFCFDIDGIIATIVPISDYSKAEPIESTIKVIQKLYKQGHKIILNTARGYVTKIDWRTVTEQQMKDWGVPYHQLIVGEKPASDFYIDDKNTDLDMIKKLFEN